PLSLHDALPIYTDPGADTHTDPGAYGSARESWLRVRDRWLDAGSARKPRCESGGCALRKWCTEARRHGRVATDRTVRSRRRRTDLRDQRVDPLGVGSRL